MNAELPNNALKLTRSALAAAAGFAAALAAQRGVLRMALARTGADGTAPVIEP